MTDIASDTILAEQYRAGDRTALAELYRRHRPGLFRFCLRLLRDRDSAEDAVQSTFLKLQAGSAPPVRSGSVKSWMYAVARNESFGELRRRRSEPLDEETVWNGPPPDEALAAKDRNAAVMAALDALYPSFREVIVLREFEQLSYDEIAAVTGTTVPSVKSRLFKARKAMAGALTSLISEERR
ncbi:MAG: sigma-70 family RNA polymerase sigma factor [Bacteroidetes bacterium]|nr:MAG: sigma-70 family RNA polymerase sigma factor [Bacteroidota bacterium]